MDGGLFAGLLPGGAVAVPDPRQAGEPYRSLPDPQPAGAVGAAVESASDAHSSLESVVAAAEASRQLHKK